MYQLDSNATNVTHGEILFLHVREVGEGHGHPPHVPLEIGRCAFREMPLRDVRFNESARTALLVPASYGEVNSVNDCRYR